ncbi:MAG: ATP-binding protein, partial [Bacteroidetes bacterium RIFCSPLOWO2_02_FULL_36_8]
MKPTHESITNSLRKVIEPDLGKDLISLEMIKDIIIEGNTVNFILLLTTPACPLIEKMKSDCKNAILNDHSKDLLININTTHQVTTLRSDAGQVLPGVKNIIAIASGKGGVGKSTIAANLAVGLALNNAKVGLIDADIYGPSMPIMFNLRDAKPMLKNENGRNLMVPVEAYGVKILSIGFLVDPKQSVVWRGPMASSALRQFVTDAEWGELDYLLIDLPPGTGDIHLTLVQTVPVTGAIIVTTPQEVSLADAEKGLDMFASQRINVPVLGIVENMAYFIPEELPGNKYFIFGKDGGKKLAEERKVPLLGQIPLVQGICESGDKGAPIVLKTGHPMSIAFMELAKSVAQQVAIRNAKFDA